MTWESNGDWTRAMGVSRGAVTAISAAVAAVFRRPALHALPIARCSRIHAWYFSIGIGRA